MYRTSLRACVRACVFDVYRIVGTFLAFRLSAVVLKIATSNK